MPTIVWGAAHVARRLEARGRIRHGRFDTRVAGLEALEGLGQPRCGGGDGADTRPGDAYAAEHTAAERGERGDRDDGEVALADGHLLEGPTLAGRSRRQSHL